MLFARYIITHQMLILNLKRSGYIEVMLEHLASLEFRYYS
jgi:hypothetical protein